MKILVTGACGFVGSHLIEYLRTISGVEIFGVDRPNVKKNNIKHLDPYFNYSEVELTDMNSVAGMIREIKPDKIFHLAAQSFVPLSWKAPAETFNSNVIGQLNIFEALKQEKLYPVIQIACSSEEYGLVYPDETPIKETNPLRPQSTYGVSKIAQEYLAYQYNQSYGFKTVITRAFNHTGPRRGEQFVTSSFAKQIASIEKGLQEPAIKVGALSSQRDFTDVRDMVRAYWLATEHCAYGEPYNISSDVTHTIMEILYILLSKSTTRGIKAEIDPARLRPSDVPILLGDSTKFRNQTDWYPLIPLEETLDDLLNYWREVL
jgi:GDP-4-dehydro-6-deoxy-D-mannose reductase